MNEKMRVFYDDRKPPAGHMRKVIGDKRFADIIYKRKPLYVRFREAFAEYAQGEMQVLRTSEDARALLDKGQIEGQYGRVLHIYSYCAIADSAEFSLLLGKLQYSKVNVALMRNDTPLLLYFATSSSYYQFLNREPDVLSHELIQSLELNRMEDGSLYDISDYKSFVSYLSGSFSARHFNALSGTEYVVTKRSKNIDKMKREYTYYHLLPEEMQSSFVLPYGYQENADWAGYHMERYNMPDMAIRWVHGSVTLEEMDVFLKRAMYFIKTRKTKTCGNAVAEQVRRTLYLEKVAARVAQLRAMPEGKMIEAYIANGTEYASLSEIIRRYESITELCEKSGTADYLVIGHGDFCFSNILYDSDNGLLRLIDPKGALTEEELWTDPYYDLAKLSHSICGRYDFINSDLYELQFDDTLKYHLTFPFDNSPFVSLFQTHLKANGLSYEKTRVYEASLFLSMLPLHIDIPKKVFAFIINAVQILEEVSRFWKK